MASSFLNETLPTRHRLIKHTLTPKYGQSTNMLNSGDVDVAELSRPQFVMEFETTRLKDEDFSIWEAWMMRRNQGGSPFLYTPLHRPLPKGIETPDVQPVLTYRNKGVSASFGPVMSLFCSDPNYRPDTGSYFSYTTEKGGVYFGTCVRRSGYNVGDQYITVYPLPAPWGLPLPHPDNPDFRFVNPVMRCRILPDSYDPDIAYLTSKISFSAYQIHG